MRTTDVDQAHLLAMRVAVAKDVINQLDLAKIVACSGVYISVGDDLRYQHTPPAVMFAAERGDDLSTVLDLLPQCHVCAIGASLLSYARLFDSVPMGVPGHDMTGVQFYYSGATENVKRTARATLGDEFIDAIEQVFESWDDGQRRAYYDEEKYGETGSEQRMRAIMNDVIEQGGEFVVPPHYRRGQCL